MKAILRAGTAILAAALAAAPAIAPAQTAPAQTPTPPPAATTNSTSPVAIGPSELQNFNLKGTVTRQADQPAVVTPSRPQTAPVRPPALSSAPPRAPKPRSAERTATPGAPGNTASTEQAVSSNLTPPPVVSESSPALQQPLSIPSAPVSQSAPTEQSNPFSRLPLWPWIAAALALVAAAGFLWRRSQREPAYEGGQYDLLVPASPEPEPQQLPPAPAPAPPVEAPAARPAVPAGTVTSRLRPAAPSGIVASRLRPALELAFHPLRCQVDDDQVAIEFELELFNAGTAPARAIFAEASLLNASATQDADLAAFFQNAHGKGAALDVIPPMKRVSFRSQVVAPRASVQEYELAGRKTFVPVIAFNALYEWSGGKAQSSAAYLVGRDTQQDKLGPLRLDHGAREFSGLGARPLPSAVRT